MYNQNLMSFEHVLNILLKRWKFGTFMFSGHPIMVFGLAFMNFDPRWNPKHLNKCFCYILNYLPKLKTYTFLHFKSTPDHFISAYLI